MDKNWMELLGQKNQIQIIRQTNEYSEKYGLTLTEQDAKVLVTERKGSLQTQKRVEFGQGVLPKLIYAFCDSAYITQENYVDMLTSYETYYEGDEEMIRYLMPAVKEIIIRNSQFVVKGDIS